MQKITTVSKGCSIPMATYKTKELAYIIDENKCFTIFRQSRWEKEVCCIQCHCQKVSDNGHCESYVYQKQYKCTACNYSFKDLTGTILENNPSRLQTWVLCFFLVKLNTSIQNIAEELGIDIFHTRLIVERLQGNLANIIDNTKREGNDSLEYNTLTKNNKTNSIIELMYNDEYGINPPLQHWAIK